MPQSCHIPHIQIWNLVRLSSSLANGSLSDFWQLFGSCFINHKANCCCKTENERKSLEPEVFMMNVEILFDLNCLASICRNIFFFNYLNLIINLLNWSFSHRNNCSTFFIFEQTLAIMRLAEKMTFYQVWFII